MSDARYLVWSNQHAMWWRPGEIGYTKVIEEAGRYDLATARLIAERATVGGRLVHRSVDPMTGRAYEWLDECVVPAPETIDEQG